MSEVPKSRCLMSAWSHFGRDAMYWWKDVEGADLVDSWVMMGGCSRVTGENVRESGCSVVSTGIAKGGKGMLSPQGSRWKWGLRVQSSCCSSVGGEGICVVPGETDGRVGG
jgi:hypothetical protein